MYTRPPMANSILPILGCMHILSSTSQEGKRLSLICTVWHTKEEAEGIIVFLCKDRFWDCSPETSLEQLRLTRDPGRESASERSSQLVFTIDQATPLDSGNYQCCARSQKPDIRLQGHIFTVLVTGELLISLIPPGETVSRINCWRQKQLFQVLNRQSSGGKVLPITQFDFPHHSH